MRYLKLYEQFRLISENIQNLDKISSAEENELVRMLGDQKIRESGIL